MHARLTRSDVADIHVEGRKEDTAGLDSYCGSLPCLASASQMLIPWTVDGTISRGLLGNMGADNSAAIKNAWLPLLTISADIAFHR